MSESMSATAETRFNSEMAADADHLPDRGQNIAWRRDSLASKHRNGIVTVPRQKEPTPNAKTPPPEGDGVFAFVKS